MRLAVSAGRLEVLDHEVADQLGGGAVAGGVEAEDDDGALEQRVPQLDLALGLVEGQQPFALAALGQECEPIAQSGEVPQLVRGEAREVAADLLAGLLV